MYNHMKLITTNEFISKAKKIHGHRYKYHRSEYKSAKTKIIVICDKHGEFEQMPYHHLEGSGCSKCQRETQSFRQRKGLNDFSNQAEYVHGGIYDYSKSIYISSNSKIIIICKVHGEFKQSPNSHLAGHGCPMCAIKLRKKRFSSSINEFVRKSKKIHGNYYDYGNVVYKQSHIKIIIICPKHGKFEQTPASHLNGNGCPRCSHVISNPEVEFLNFLNVPQRNYRIPEWKLKAVDGFDPKTNTIYEFLGDYWHGNPMKYDPKQIHPRRKISFRQMFDETFTMLNKLKQLGYNVCYIWETDWKKWDKQNPIPLQIIK